MDQFYTRRRITRRRMLMAGAAFVGATGAAGAAALLTGEESPRPAPAPGTSTAASRPRGRRRAVPRTSLPRTGSSPSPDTARRAPVPGPPSGAHRCCACRGCGRTMVLTFDDGPDPRYTPDILRTLRRYDVRAMFFVCGEAAAANKNLLRQMADDGHIVGNHTWSHPLLTRTVTLRDPLADGTHL